MKHNYALLLTILLTSIIGFEAAAQCVGPRYKQAIFANNTVHSDIVYGNNINLQGNPEDLLLDVYEPTGDTETNRPLVIVAHGGSFVGGSKTGTDVVPICNDLASHGYVVASIDYRLGMAGLPIPGPDSVAATESVMRAYHDGKAAVRYFRKDAAENGNTYDIDPNRIYFLGVSAGGFIAVQIAYLDQVSEIPSYIDTTQAGMGGGLEGTSGNPGYSSDVAGVINICGALKDTSWMQPGDEPILSLHGPNDGTVPYGTDIIVLLGFYPLLEIDGSASIHARAENIGLDHCFETYEGQDHVPHVGNAQYYDTTFVFTRNFLAHLVCNEPMQCSYSSLPVAIDDVQPEYNQFAVFPNPARDQVTLNLEDLNLEDYTLEVYDGTGRMVRQLQGLNDTRLVVDRETLDAGIYLINIIHQNNRYSSRVIFE